MVRKRSRKYKNDENDSDSDLDFDFEQQSSKPAPKKYSLRERKRATLFPADYDYYGLDEEDGGAKRGSSDDEDFEVQTEVDVNGARSFFEPDPDVDPQNSEGLIDFEDIIRADIVVNRNKIDYDNLIQKTEIKLTQPKKRGRKPKNRPDESITKEEKEEKCICEPELGTLEALEERDGEETEENMGLKDSEEGLPNGGAVENVESGELKKDDSDTTNCIEMVLVEPPPIQEDEEKKEEDEDDDVIILGELKQDVIVLDD